MAMSENEAREVAKKQLGSDHIALSETSDKFIASVSHGRGEEVPGEMPISIDKKTGAVEEILLPSKEGFRAIKGAKPVHMMRKTE